MARPFDTADHPKSDTATRILLYQCNHVKELDDGTLEFTGVNLIDGKNDVPRTVKNMTAGSMISNFMKNFSKKLVEVDAKIAAQ